MKKPREPSKEERKLWRYVTRTTKPMREILEEEEGEDVEPELPKKIAKKERAEKPNLPAKPLKKDTTTLTLGHYANIDKNTATEFKKGKWKPDATLDLHGFTRDEAHEALAHFIKTAYDRGRRRVIIITGKGTLTGRGVLQAAAPLWLASLRNYILAYDYATQKDGGKGALYVLLKRKR